MAKKVGANASRGERPKGLAPTSRRRSPLQL